MSVGHNVFWRNSQMDLTLFVKQKLQSRSKDLTNHHKYKQFYNMQEENLLTHN